MDLKENRLQIYAGLLSGLAGIITAYSIIVTHYQDKMSAPLDWAVTLTLFTLGFGVIYFLIFPYALKQIQKTSTVVKYWGIVLTVISALFFTSWRINALLVVAAWMGLLVISIDLPTLQELLDQKRALRFVIAWALGGFVSFFVMGFLKNFYPSLWELVLITILLNALITIAFDFILEYAITSLREQIKEKIILLGVLALGILLIALTVHLLPAYPHVFSIGFFLPEVSTVPFILGLTILSQSLTAFLMQKLDARDWRTSPFAKWIQRNLPGLLLAASITIVTFALATYFTYPGFNNTDNYFDADPSDWINRLTANVPMVMRPVHPFAFLVFRPLTWLLSLFMNGEKFYAALLLNALLGGTCTFLTWLYFKRSTQNSTYALLIAALLGLSNAHLTLSVFLESYIFSATVLVAFLVLLQAEDKKLAWLVPAGLLSFGITITNFAQTCVLFFMTHPRVKTIIKYVVLVVSFATVLAYVQHILYPSSEPFYLPASYWEEKYYQFNLFKAAQWLVIARANVLARTISLFSVVAPRPLIFLQETGCHFPCSMVFYYTRAGKFAFSSYVGFGNIVVYAWFLLLIVAGIWFIVKFVKSPRSSALPIALLINILFNFAFHMNYGDDPMLYSPDWTYAVVFFVGIAYESLASKKWFQIILLIFLVGLVINNLNMFRLILDAISPFFK